MDIQTAVSLHKEAYFDRPHRTLQSYDKEFGQIWRKLPPTGDITIELLIATIIAIPDDTRQRKRAVRACQKLAEIADLEIDFSRYSGRYSPTKTKARILPSDPEIVRVYHSIESPKWRWAYGAIATYGIRPHEVFFLKINSDGTANVSEGKTGPRKIWPFLPEWYYDFRLTPPKIPGTLIKDRTYELIGNSVLYALRNTAKIPFKVYDLRHAWAVRVMTLGLRDHLAAKQMGHSIEVHQRIYQHWISDREHQAAFDQIMQKRSTLE